MGLSENEFDASTLGDAKSPVPDKLCPKLLRGTEVMVGQQLVVFQA